MSIEEIYDTYLRSVNANDTAGRIELLRACATEDLEICSPAYVVTGIEPSAQSLEDVVAVPDGRLTMHRRGPVLAHHEVFLAQWQVILPAGAGLGPAGYHFGELEDDRIFRLCVFLEGAPVTS